MRILGLVPARGGSKGILQKNIKILGGKPLIAYTIEAALATKNLTELIVSTDDATIAEVSEHYGAQVPFSRPALLASDTAPTIDTVIHALDFYDSRNIYFDALCLLQPTCPFRTTADIDRAIVQFQLAGSDSLVSVREVPHQYNPHWVFFANEETQNLRIATGENQIISRRQDLPTAYHRDGAIYITKTDVIRKQKSLYGQSVSYSILDNPHAINLDTMEDWQIAEEIIRMR